jgi:hypothetical protein
LVCQAEDVTILARVAIARRWVADRFVIFSMEPHRLSARISYDANAGTGCPCRAGRAEQSTGTTRNPLFWSTVMSRTPNDDRSDSLNPNNPAYEASQENRANQLNPNNEGYQGDDGDDE